ncbi:MAG: hypothetical protein BGO78_14255 [Chloroflexi bacterium 44-23]|nr:MAG: hypothetical protein BGO78_14255 [Chloroflexi bacterium 44-23]
MKNISTQNSGEKSQGQILVIFGISLLALLFFVGLALDAGSLYVTYGHLKRTVDSAAIAAANEFKRGADSTSMAKTANEVMTLMNTDMDTLNLQLYVCDEKDNSTWGTPAYATSNTPDGIRDPNLETASPVFWARCPDTLNGETPKKLVWIEATQKAPLYFLTLMGFTNISLTTNTISEAAPLDLVIVLDVSESMGKNTDAAYSYIEPNNLTNGCNKGSETVVINGTATVINGICQPLLNAKIAAIKLVNTLYDTIDQVSIVTYSNVAIAHGILPKVGATTVYLSDDMKNVKDAIADIKLNDDAPVSKLWGNWFWYAYEGRQVVNLANPEDRDNDGRDIDDDMALYGANCPWPADPADDATSILGDRWWGVTESPAPPAGLFAPGGKFEGWSGVPCDRDDKYDSYDWDGNGVWTLDEHQTSIDYLAANDPDGAGPLEATLAPLSTCIGCGIYTGGNVLKQAGRYGSVWVMVFLTDGQANLSDTPATNPEFFDVSDPPLAYPNGFCNSTLGGNVGGPWGFKPNAEVPPSYEPACRDLEWSPRYCIKNDPDTCPVAPTGVDWSVVTVPSGAFEPRYSVMDYARDMIDQTALTESENPHEALGADIAVYTIGLGNIGDVSTKLLRYMALIGIEGRRDVVDPCIGKSNETWCGQYYYDKGSGEDLSPIFEDIASRIFTRISQ